MSDATRLSANAFIAALFVYGLIVAYGFSGGGRWFPLFVTSFGAVIAIINLYVDFVGFRRARGMNAGIADSVSTVDAGEFRSAAGWLLWILGYGLVVYVVGVMVGTAVWLMSFFRFAGHFSWRFIAISVPAALGVLYLYADVMNLRWPNSLFF